METENWKGIEGHISYEVSDLGRIKSLPKRTRRLSRIMRQTVFTNGYLFVSLVKDGKSKNTPVHRLVCEAFHPNPENKEQVNHIDGNKQNNRADNLEWNTRSENQKHSIRAGLRTTKGQKNSQSKLTETQVLLIRASKERTGVIARQFGISAPTVCDIKKRRSWAHLA